VIRVAYLNTRYPALSHTFIEREIRAVRARGVEIHTFSIRAPRPPDLLSARHREAARTTTYVLQPGRILRALARASLRPWALVRTLAASQRLSPPGLRARLLHCAYALEALALARELRARGLRHVHVHMADNGAAVAQLASVFDGSLRYSLSIHGSEEFLDVKAFALTRKVERAQFVRCISSFCRAQVMAWSDPELWGRLHVVHCGIDPQDFLPRRRPAEGGGALKVLTVGRLDPIKGYELLLDACRRLVADGVALSLRMVGDGPLRGRLESRIHALGLDGTVELAGAVGQEELQRHYEWADVMVVSSFMEGLPVVLMEAMAKEVAVVATSVAGIPELVGHGTSGLLATPASEDDLHRHLRSMAADRASTVSMGKKGRERVLAEYAIQQVAERMAALFATYVGEEPAAGPRADAPPRQRAAAEP
jgi:glycosyltransferase involved in cell wall biosynthesis